MNKLTFIAALSLVTFVSSAQQLSMYKSFGGVRFEYNRPAEKDTVTVSTRQVSEILSVDPQAFAEFKVARTNATVAGILGFAGGFMIALPVGTAIAGGDPEWGFAAGGAACILASIPFSRAFYKRASSAVDNYNSRHGGSARLKPELQWKGTYLSLSFRF